MKPEKSGMMKSEDILSSFSSLPSDEQIEVISSLVGQETRKHNLSLSEVFGPMLPFGIFAQDKLSSLEAIVKFLKEVEGLSFPAIAGLLGRDSRTIWATYSKSQKKMPELFRQIRDEVMMPSSLIADRSLSVLEHVVLFAKNLGYSNHEVALLLHLDDRTIWSVLHRAKKKMGGML